MQMTCWISDVYRLKTARNYKFLTPFFNTTFKMFRKACVHLGCG